MFKPKIYEPLHEKKKIKMAYASSRLKLPLVSTHLNQTQWQAMDTWFLHAN